MYSSYSPDPQCAGEGHSDCSNTCGISVYVDSPLKPFLLQQTGTNHRKVEYNQRIQKALKRPNGTAYWITTGIFNRSYSKNTRKSVAHLPIREMIRLSTYLSALIPFNRNGIKSAARKPTEKLGTPIRGIPELHWSADNRLRSGLISATGAAPAEVNGHRRNSLISQNRPVAFVD